MSKIQESINKVKTFIEEVRAELKKCSWPTRTELVDSTVMVIISVAIIGIFVAASDVVLLGMLRLIIR